MPLVYVVDDESSIRQLACLALKDYGMDAEGFGSGADLMSALNHREPECIILDWMMPAPDGLQICRDLRSNIKFKHIPIIMLTARGDELDKVLGLEMGADDYICKPFGVKELPARVRAILRRQELSRARDLEVIERGPFSLYLNRRRLKKNGEDINLTQKEFDLFAQLIGYPGQVFTRELLLDRVWQMDFFGDTRTVDVHIRYLRQKLEDDPSKPKYILTLRGVGYCFSEDIEQEDKS